MNKTEHLLIVGISLKKKKGRILLSKQLNHIFLDTGIRYTRFGIFSDLCHAVMNGVSWHNRDHYLVKADKTMHDYINFFTSSLFLTLDSLH